MKQAGVVRRIDNLGRIVIPKEIRKTLRIQNGDNLEIFLDENDGIVLKKYSQIDRLNEIAQDITDSVLLSSNHSVFIASNDEFIAGSGKLKKKYLNKKISNELLNILNKRKMVFAQNNKIFLTEEDIFEGNYVIEPIISSGDIIGFVMMLDTEKIDEEETKIVKIISNFLAKHIE